jgi:hypothetical protein
MTEELDRREAMNAFCRGAASSDRLRQGERDEFRRRVARPDGNVNSQIVSPVFLFKARNIGPPENGGTENKLPAHASIVVQKSTCRPNFTNRPLMIC